ncbi:MAG: restriction endonuclease subunit S [Anaerostipes sp.]
MEYKLSEIFDLQMGKTPDRRNRDYWNAATEPWISIADLSKCDKYIDKTSECISKQAVEESGIKIIPKNTVIMSFKLSIGKLAITPKEMYSNEAIMAFIDKGVTQFESTYLYYLLMHKEWNEGTNKAVMGKTLNKVTLSEMKIKIHDYEKQMEIINVLDKTKSIINDRKQQLEQFNLLIKARFVEMFGDPVLNPMGWEMPLIEDVVANEKNALKAGPFGSALKKEFYTESGYKIYGQEQVISGDHRFGDYYIGEERYKTLENCAVQAGDVLISLVGTYGKLLIMPDDFEPGIINPRLMKITFDKEKVNPLYFQYYFQSESLKKALSENTHGGTMDILNLGIVRKLGMPLPPLSLQNEFVDFTIQVDKSKVAVQKSLDEAQLLFDSLMQKYFG